MMYLLKTFLSIRDPGSGVHDRLDPAHLRPLALPTTPCGVPERTAASPP